MARGRVGSLMSTTFNPSSSVTNAYWNWIAIARGLRKETVRQFADEPRLLRLIHIDHRETARRA